MMEVLSRYGSFTEIEANSLNDIGKFKFIKAKDIVFESGKVFNKLYFVREGIIRAYRLIDGEDYTYFFFSNNDFAVDYQSFLTDTQSPLYFETLTSTSLIEFNKEDIYLLYDKYPKFERLGRIMAENAYLSAADRLKQHQTDDLKTRYQKLIAKNPILFQTVSQHYIASYLGVKPQSLSRIRAEIAGKKY